MENNSLSKIRKITNFGMAYAASGIRAPLSEKTSFDISKPVQLYWMVTRKCNFKCEFCDVIRHDNDPKLELNDDEIEKFINQMADWGIYKLGISGGEPLIRKEKVIKAISIAHKHGIWTGLGTNGSLLNEETAKD